MFLVDKKSRADELWEGAPAASATAAAYIAPRKERCAPRAARSLLDFSSAPLLFCHFLFSADFLSLQFRLLGIISRPFSLLACWLRLSIRARNNVCRRETRRGAQPLSLSTARLH